jgi:hypothetical protein
MVLVHDETFEIQLVEAVSKRPFPEHYKDGQTYIEVEPDAEYFVGIRKIAASRTPLIVTIKVDGKSLGLRYRYHRQKSSAAKYKGIANVKIDGTIDFCALKFVKPSLSRVAHQSEAWRRNIQHPRSLGNVEINIYEGKERLFQQQTAILPKDDDWSTDFGVPQVALLATTSGSGGSKKKCLRSRSGHASVASKVETTRFKQKALLETITLNYCATPGLIMAGVFPSYATNTGSTLEATAQYEGDEPTTIGSSAASISVVTPDRAQSLLSDEVEFVNVKQELTAPIEIVDLTALD